MHTSKYHAAKRTRWDVIVIGAGPAGALAAREIARFGHAVLLVDKAMFPRDKVCGCCLNAHALSTFRSVDLREVVERCKANTIHEARVSAGRASATLRLREGACVSRASLDSELVNHAIDVGAQFMQRTLAMVGRDDDGDGVTVSLESIESKVAANVQARCVIVADGLAGTALAHRSEFTVDQRKGSRFGAAIILDSAPEAYGSGKIFMSIGSGGYVGAVRLEDGRLNVAAAFDLAFVRASGGPARATARILADANAVPIPQLTDGRWHGAPAFTRRRQVVESARIMLIGDAAGYVEPFTGEGMAWALTCGAAVAPIVRAKLESDRWQQTGAWTAAHHLLVVRRQRLCHAAACVLRRPRLTRATVHAMAHWPRLTSSMLHRIENVHGSLCLDAMTSLVPAPPKGAAR